MVDCFLHKQDIIIREWLAHRDAAKKCTSSYRSKIFVIWSFFVANSVYSREEAREDAKIDGKLKTLLGRRNRRSGGLRVVGGQKN